MFTKEEKAKLEQINKLFTKIENIYEQFDRETQDYIAQYHNMEGSLPHCIRWGITGTEELLNEKTVYEIGAQFVVLKEIDCGDGYIPFASIGRLEHIHSNQLHDEDCRPFRFEFETFLAYEEKDAADGCCRELSLKEIENHLKLRKIIN